MDIQQLFLDNFVQLKKFARRWSRSDAGDVVDEAFLKLFMADPMPEPPLPWLYRVIRNISINQSIRAEKLPI